MKKSINKECFSETEGWNDFINDYIKFKRKRRPILEKAISILEESLELMSKVKCTDEDILKNYRELIGETSRLKEYIKNHS